MVIKSSLSNYFLINKYQIIIKLGSIMKEKEKQVYEILKSHDYKDKEIAGIMANIDVETGGTFDYTTKQKGGKGQGLFQFDQLKKYYNQYLIINGFQDSAQAQIKFMDSTIRGENKNIIGEGNAKKINDTFKNGTATQISKIFCEKWQRPGVPHLERRIESARNYETIFSIKEAEDLLQEMDISKTQKSITSNNFDHWQPNYKYIDSNEDNYQVEDENEIEDDYSNQDYDSPDYTGGEYEMSDQDDGNENDGNEYEFEEGQEQEQEQYDDEEGQKEVYELKKGDNYYDQQHIGKIYNSDDDQGEYNNTGFNYGHEDEYYEYGYDNFGENNYNRSCQNFDDDIDYFDLQSGDHDFDEHVDYDIDQDYDPENFTYDQW